MRTERARLPSTLLELKIRELDMTLDEFVQHAEQFARDHGQRGTISLRHLQRLISPAERPAALRPATRGLLEAIFATLAAELLGPPLPERAGADHVGDILVLGVLDPADALDAVDLMTASVVDRYEIDGPLLLVGEVHELRGVCSAIANRTGVGLRHRLATAAARQAALLAYMSVNLGRPVQAQRYAAEATVLATAAHDRDLLAWIKGTQSFAAYYQGRYRDALRLAEAGLRIDGAPGQRARLLSNGVARAAGRLGEASIVQRAVDSALDSTADTELTSCISFGPYGQARTLANAATAYLAAGRVDEVLDVTDALDDVVQHSDSDWSRALVRLDAASAHARRADADLDHAASLGLQALHASRSNPIASISVRATDLVDDLIGRAGTSTAVTELRGSLHAWHASSGLGT